MPVVTKKASRSFDKILDICIKAASRFNSNRDKKSDGVFNSAAYAAVVREEFGSTIDSAVVQEQLKDIPFVKPLHGGCHWQLDQSIMKDSNDS